MQKQGVEMRIDTVEELIEDIFSVPDDALANAEEWINVTNQLAVAIGTANDLLIIQTYSERYEGCDPYLQICYEEDGAMTIEAVSNRFLHPKLSVDAQNTMHELGWELSDEPNLPNYFKFLHKEDAIPLKVAKLFADTLRNAYGITTSDTIEIRTGRGVWSNHDSQSSLE
jgi:hypothetical protein